MILHLRILYVCGVLNLLRNACNSQGFSEYIHEVNEINQNVYPDDSTEAGRYLRLKQQYFFVSAGLTAMIKAHLRVYPTLDNFAEKNCIQLNDTHPVLAIPEMMRILLDDYRYEWNRMLGRLLKMRWLIRTIPYWLRLLKNGQFNIFNPCCHVST